MTDEVSIIIPAFNELHYCRQCVDTVLLHTRAPYRLILVDNGSTDGVGEYFDSVAGATVIHTGQNLGFAGGVNRGIEHASGHILLLNSDTVMPREWLEPLVDALRRAPDVGMVGPRSNCVSGPQQIDGLEFQSFDEIDAYARALREQHAGRVQVVNRLVGFCLLIRDEAAAAVGTFDERFGIGNFEDDDYALRVRRAGYSLCIAEDAFVYHYGSRTFHGMGITGEDWQALLHENEAKFKSKWQESQHVARELNARARECLQKGETAKALRLYQEAIAAAPNDSRAYNDLGVLLWNLAEKQRAIACWQKALAINPADGDAKQNLRNAEQQDLT